MDTEDGAGHDEDLCRARRGEGDEGAQDHGGEDTDVGDDVEQTGNQPQEQCVFDAEEPQGQEGGGSHDDHFQEQAEDVLPDTGLYMRDDVVYGDGILFLKDGDEEPDDETAVVQQEESIEHNKHHKKHRGGDGHHGGAQHGGSGGQQLGGCIVKIGVLLFDTDMKFGGDPVLKVV